MFNLLLIDPLRENMGNGGTNRNKPSNLGVSLYLCYTSIVIRMVIIRPKNNMCMYIYIYIHMYVLYLYICVISILYVYYMYITQMLYIYITCVLHVYMYICIYVCLCVFVYMCICVVCIHIHPYINGSTTCNHDSNKK